MPHPVTVSSIANALSLSARMTARGQTLLRDIPPKDWKAAMDWPEEGTHLDSLATRFAVTPTLYFIPPVIQISGDLKVVADKFAAAPDLLRARRIQGARGCSTKIYEWPSANTSWVALVDLASDSFHITLAFNDGIRDHMGGYFSIEIGHPIAEEDDHALYTFMCPLASILPADDTHMEALDQEEQDAYDALGSNGFSRIVNEVLYAVGAHIAGADMIGAA